MAYGLKYYADYIKGSTQIRVEVHQRDYTGTAYYMATIQGLTLEIGGGSEPIYTPVVKTTVSFSLADAFDVGSTVDGVECVTNDGGVLSKHGRWEEFYTNDATRYKVVLLSAGEIIWQGYITPDSWKEAMVYRGSITVVARDMLGTLQDVTFNPETVDGLISVGDLISDAITVSQAAMDVLMISANVPWNLTKNVSIFSAKIRVAAFEDRSWWEALTGTLEALGLVLRYDGAGGWKVVAVRYIPTLSSGSRSCEFTNRSGLRTMDPPVRDIDGTFTVESDEYQLQPFDAAELTADAYQGYVFSKGGAAGPGAANRVYPATLAHNSGSWATKQFSARPSLLYKPELPITDALKEAGFVDFAPMYFIANTSNSADGDWDQTKLLGEATIISGRIKAASKLIIRVDGLILTQSDTAISIPTAANDGQIAVEYVELLIVADVNGTAYFYTSEGEWVAQETYYRMEFAGGQGSVDILAPEGVDDASYTVSLAYIRVPASQVWYPSTGANWHGYFVPLAFYLAYPDGASVAREYNVKTVYNDDYNVRITRTPALGCVDTALAGAFLKNALLHGDAPIPDRWGWYNENIEVPLEVLVQMQLLQFYAASASIFTGTLHDKGGHALPGAGYNYFQRDCVLLRGTFDFASGMILDAALREFYTWSQVWGSTEPDWTRRTKGSADDSGGSGSGGSSSGGGKGGSESYANTMAIAAMRARIEALESFWDKDTDGNIFAKNHAGIYTYSFLSAGGKSPDSGGGGGGASSLSELNDVRLSTLSSGQMLIYNGSYWVNSAVPSGGVQSDWSETDSTSPAYIKHKPTIPSAPGTLITNLSTAQTVSEGESLSGTIRLHKVAKTGAYSDLRGTPDLSVYVVNSDLLNYIGKVTSATANNVAVFAGGGGLADSGIAKSGLALLAGDQTFTGNNIFSNTVRANGVILDGHITPSDDRAYNLGANDGYFKEGHIEDIYVKSFIPWKQQGATIPGDSNPASGGYNFYTIDANGRWNNGLALTPSEAIVGSQLRPASDGALSLGLADYRWGNLFARYIKATDSLEAGSIYAYNNATAFDFYIGNGSGGWLKALQLNNTQIEVNRHVVPNANQTYDLGANSLRWRYLFANRWYPNGANGPYIEYDSAKTSFKVNGNMYVTGFLTAGASGQNDVQSSISYSLVPTQSGAYNLGSDGYKFGTLYANTVRATSIYTTDLTVTNLNYVNWVTWGSEDNSFLDLLDGSTHSNMAFSTYGIDTSVFADIISGKIVTIKFYDNEEDIMHITEAHLSGSRYITIYFGRKFRLVQTSATRFTIYGTLN